MISNMIEMGFDGAATFSGRHIGVQALLKRNSPHLILYTATAIYYNLLKPLTVPIVSDMFTPHSLHYGSTFIIHQNKLNV